MKIGQLNDRFENSWTTGRVGCCLGPPSGRARGRGQRREAAARGFTPPDRRRRRPGITSQPVRSWGKLPRPGP